MNRTQRTVSGEKLLTVGVIGYTLTHEVHRVIHVHKEGLTEAELVLLKKAETDLKNAIRKIGVVRKRCV